MADRMTLAHALEESGMARGAAEDIATAIYDAIHDNVATKTDLEALGAALRGDMIGLRADMRSMEQRLDLRFEQTERRIDNVVVRLGALVVIVAGMLLGALHYWPPHA